MTLPPIDQLVPQRGPMILLDRVTDFTGDACVCEVTVREGALFVEGGRAHASVMLEYMAQSVAALVGLRLHGRGDPVRVGYLLGAREMLLHVDHLPVGARLAVRAEYAWGDEVLGSFRTEVREGDAVLAAATLNVYRGDIEGMPG